MLRNERRRLKLDDDGMLIFDIAFGSAIIGPALTFMEPLRNFRFRAEVGGIIEAEFE